MSDLSSLENILTIKVGDEEFQEDGIRIICSMIGPKKCHIVFATLRNYFKSLFSIEGFDNLLFRGENERIYVLAFSWAAQYSDCVASESAKNDLLLFEDLLTCNCCIIKSCCSHVQIVRQQIEVEVLRAGLGQGMSELGWGLVESLL